MLRPLAIVSLLAITTTFAPADPPSTGDMPPDIKAILVKGSKATPEEKQKLLDWMMKKRTDKMPHAPNGGPSLAAFEITSQLPKERPELHLENRAVPSETAYIKLANDLAFKMSAELGKVRATADHWLAATHDPIAISNAGAGLVMDPDGLYAAIYLVAHAAVLAPKNPLIANNLGALVKNASDFDHALDLFLYTDALAPKQAAIVVQRAWAELQLGDFRTADGHFQTALSLDPESASAMEGLGVLSFARGDSQKGADWMRKSLAKGYSMMAGMGARAQPGEDKPGKEPPPIADDKLVRPGDAMPAKAGGSGSVTPDAESGAGFAPVWAVPVAAPTIPTQAEMMIAQTAMWANWANHLAEQHKQGLENLRAKHAELAAHPPDFAPQRLPGGAIHVPRRYTRAQGLLAYAQVRAEHRANALWRAFDDDFQKWNVVNGTEALSGCESRIGLAKRAHSSMGSVWGKAMSKAVTIANEFLSETRKPLRSINDNRLNYVANLARKEAVMAILYARADIIGSWALAVGGFMAPQSCNVDVPKPDPKPKSPDDDEQQASKEKCKMPPGAKKAFDKWGHGFHADCDGWTFDASIDLFGEKTAINATHKWGSGETSLQATQGGEFAKGDFKASGSIGAKVVFDNAGHVLDGGIVTEGTLSYGDNSAGLTTELMVNGGYTFTESGTGLGNNWGTNLVEGAEAVGRATGQQP